MAIRTYQVMLTGKTPLLLHADNVDWADTMEAWKNDPANKQASKAGDDRSPAFRWIGYLHHDTTHVILPNEMLASSMMGGGALVPTGKGQKTFKAQTQSGMMVGEEGWPLLLDGHPISYAQFPPMMEEPLFAAHRTFAQNLGFQLFIKRARIGQSKHIRVRPRFDRWQAQGTIQTWDDQITEEVLKQILFYAGAYKGLGDWRPGGKTPGPWGTFSAEVKAA